MSKQKEAGNSLPQVFKYTDVPIHVRFIELVPWFAAKDVCNVLSLKDPHKVVSGLEEDERQVLPGVDSRGRKNRMIYVNESGMYGLTFRSTKPQAKLFRKWVTSEVLPALRQKGSYKVKQSKSLKPNPREEYRELYEVAAAAAEICGSNAKLGKRLGIAPSTFSHILHRPWLLSPARMKLIERGCRNIVHGGGANTDVDAIESLLQIDDRQSRLYLFNKMKEEACYDSPH